MKLVTEYSCAIILFVDFRSCNSNVMRDKGVPLSLLACTFPACVCHNEYRNSVLAKILRPLLFHCYF